jgi:hypothetical protein
MTSGSVVSLSSMLEEIADIAGILNRPRLLETIEGVLEHRRAAKLQLLVVGSAGSGRSTLANILLRQPGLLPESPIPKPPVGIEVQHGERMSAIRVGADDSHTALPPGRLRSVLTDPDGGHGERVMIHAPCDLLEMCDLRIESLEAGLSPTGRRAVLGGTDYVILLLNGTALLSNAERQFVRDGLAAEVGLERVALVVTHMDLVPEDERDSILELLTTFLGPFQSQPAILSLSLREVARGGSDAAGYDALITLMNDLLEQRTPIRDAAMQQILGALLDDVEAAVTEIEALYALEEEDVRRVKEGIASQRAWLERRIERVQGRIEAFVDTLLKEQLLRQIEGFSEVVRARLPQEIDSVDDIAVIRRYLPGYLETVWTEYLRGRMIAVRTELVEEETRLNAMIDADLSELLSGAGQSTDSMKRGFETDPLALHVFIMPKRGKHRASNVVRGLSLNGLFMLFFAPQMGILSLAASQVIQRIYREDISTADRQAVIASAAPASRELEREIKRRIAEQFATLTQQLKDDASSAYRRGVEQITEMLDERATHQHDLETRRAEIREIVRERLPRLRALSQQMGGEAST